MEPVGSQNSSQQGNSPISNDDMGLILTALHAYGGIDPQKIDQITKFMQAAAAPKPAEEEVPGWKPMPALLSDEQFTFGAGDQTVDVRLKILGGDWYVSELMPALEEWVTALYGSQALEMFKLAENDPIGFILNICRTIIRRPKADRLKVSFYQFCSATFSTPQAEVPAEFFAICPPDQQIGAIRKLVAINRQNFTMAWADAPLLLRHEITLLYLTAIQSIQRVRETLTSAMSSMARGIQRFLSSGGANAIGPDESSALPEEKSEPTSN